MRIPMRIGDKEFSSKSEAERYARKVRDKYPNEAPIEGTDSAFVQALFRLHHESEVRTQNRSVIGFLWGGQKEEHGAFMSNMTTEPRKTSVSRQQYLGRGNTRILDYPTDHTAVRGSNCAATNRKNLSWRSRDREPAD